MPELKVEIFENGKRVFSGVWDNANDARRHLVTFLMRRYPPKELEAILDKAHEGYP